MGDGKKENPYTREDVKKKIDDWEGNAEGLDLSGSYFEERINLKEFPLKGIILREAKFPKRALQNALVTGTWMSRQIAKVY